MGCILPIIAAACGLWLFGIPGMIIALIGGGITGWFLALFEPNSGPPPGEPHG